MLLTFRRPARRVRAQAARPKLVVFIVVDQLRGDYPVRYGGLLQHGLKRLTTEGAWFTNAAYPYLNTDHVRRTRDDRDRHAARTSTA